MNRHLLIFIGVLLSTNLCLSQTASRVILKPSENGTAFSLVDQATMNLKNGEVNQINLKLPVLINLESRIPVLLVPTAEGTSEVQLNPPTVRDATASAGQKEISLIVSEVYLGISEVQKDMQKKNLDRASAKIEELIKKYPDVSFLHFTKGSVLFLQGKKKSARRSVMKALEGHPNFTEGKEFLKALGGPVTDGETADE